MLNRLREKVQEQIVKTKNKREEYLVNQAQDMYEKRLDFEIQVNIHFWFFLEKVKTQNEIIRATYYDGFSTRKIEAVPCDVYSSIEDGILIFTFGEYEFRSFLRKGIDNNPVSTNVKWLNPHTLHIEITLNGMYEFKKFTVIVGTDDSYK